MKKNTGYVTGELKNKVIKKGTVVAFAATMCLFIVPQNTFAQAENDKFDVTTKISYSNGTVAEYDDALFTDSKKIEKNIDRIEGYSISIDGEKVLEVSPLNNNILAGKSYSAKERQYSVTVQLEGNKEAFVTGLTAENVNDVEEFILFNYDSDGPKGFEDEAFIDAEKLYNAGREDDYLCWAGMTSNILAYTGWGEYAGFENEDEVFDAFVESFDDDGADLDSGFSWFFNGVAEMGGSLIKNPGESGGYASDYAYDQIVEMHYLENDYADYRTMKHALNDGCGVGLSVNFFNTYNSGTYGHALTCWGYIVDNDYSEYSKYHYVSLVISDSDDYDYDYLDRTEASMFTNYLVLIPLEDVSNFKGVVDAGYDNLLGLKKYSAGVKSAIVEFTIVKPYNEELEKETDDAALKNKYKYPDLVPCMNIAVNSALDCRMCEYISSGENVSIYPFVENVANEGCYGKIELKLRVVNEDGKVVKSKTFSDTKSIGPFRGYSGTNGYWVLEAGKLPVGKYMAVLTCNTDIKEAYLYNNTVQFSFEVVPASKASACKLSASVKKYFSQNSSWWLEAGIGQSGFADTVVGDTTEYGIFYSRYRNGEWGEWICADYDIGKLDYNSKNFMLNENTKVKFMVIVNMREKGTFSVVSNELSLSKPKVKNATKIKAVNSGKKKVKVTFAKGKNVTAYKVQISLKKNFSKATTKKIKTNKVEFKNLKKGKTYYVRVKAIGRMETTGWSKIIKVNVKK